MKTTSDPRHQKREKLIKDLFAASFHTQRPMHQETKDILENTDLLDKSIAAAAPQWPLAKVAKIDLAILRLAVYELLISKKEPPKVVIDEAVELAKQYGSEASGSFVNGVLGTIIGDNSIHTK